MMPAVDFEKNKSCI